VLVIVGVIGFFFVRGSSSGPTIGDKNTLPPQMKAAYGVGGGKPPTQQAPNH
jgi:hypothetical protein